jgi:hypothetical protein
VFAFDTTRIGFVPISHIMSTDLLHVHQMDQHDSTAGALARRPALPQLLLYGDADSQHLPELRTRWRPPRAPKPHRRPACVPALRRNPRQLHLPNLPSGRRASSPRRVRTMRSTQRSLHHPVAPSRRPSRHGDAHRGALWRRSSRKHPHWKRNVQVLQLLGGIASGAIPLKALIPNTFAARLALVSRSRATR